MIREGGNRTSNPRRNDPANYPSRRCGEGLWSDRSGEWKGVADGEGSVSVVSPEDAEKWHGRPDDGGKAVCGFRRKKRCRDHEGVSKHQIWVRRGLTNAVQLQARAWRREAPRAKRVPVRCNRWLCGRLRSGGAVGRVKCEQGWSVVGTVVRVGRRTLAVAPKPVGSMRPDGTREMRAPGITERHGRGVPLRVERQWTVRSARTLPKRNEN